MKKGVTTAFPPWRSMNHIPKWVSHVAVAWKKQRESNFKTTATLPLVITLNNIGHMDSILNWVGAARWCIVLLTLLERSEIYYFYAEETGGNKRDRKPSANNRVLITSYGLSCDLDMNGRESEKLTVRIRSTVALPAKWATIKVTTNFTHSSGAANACAAATMTPDIVIIIPS